MKSSLDSTPANESSPVETREANARIPPQKWSRGPSSRFISAGNTPEDCIHRHFEKQVKRSPDAVAIRFGGEEWTFGRLDLHADQLAAELRDHGVGPEVLVGIHMDRSPWLFVGIMGILKAGGAYVPLDPAFPQERLRMIGEDAALKVLIADPALEADLHVPGAARVLLSPESDFITTAAPPAVVSDVSSGNLAYVIYTSGSTGKPKGVQIRHRSAVNLLFSMAAEPGFGPGDSLLAVTTISFDVSIPEAFLPLITGGRMVLAPRGVSADGEGFATMLDEHDITFVQGTPTTWRLVLAAGWRGKKNLKAVIGGEAVDRDLATKLMPLCGELWNFYGPTETTVWSTCLQMEPREGPVVIGRPLPGNDIHVLDAHLRPVPPGESGEICIGGDGVARGYANRPELTAEKFVPDPFSEVPGATMYRTGDLGRWHADGMLECQGRADHQVKLRGYRIELGEIESALKDHPAVRDAVVLISEPVPGDQRLISYILPDGSEPSRETLQEHLAARLPDYMIPSAFVMMEAFPMTPNQKIDRDTLARHTAVTKGGTNTAIHVDSAADTPTVIAAIWQSVLGLHVIGIHENVFKLGAHSMHVAKVHAELKRRFEKRITVARIFQHPTPDSLAAYFKDESPVAGVSKPVRQTNASGCRDIAIIGMSARFAGARDIDTFWRNIRDGVESISDFSEEELLTKGVSRELLADKRYVKRGCVLEDYDCFDAGFFDMSPREAEITNPQHRVFLQAAWEALEHAGYVPESYDGSIGLFAGAGHNNHAHAHPDLTGVEYLQYLVGNEHDYLTTRTAYKLGLNGPALNIQTACSTSLVAVHAACQALMSGQCDMAIAGGISISWPEGRGYLFGEGLIFSQDGKCRVFDARASGTVFGHGVGLVTLKLLDQAKADGDTIHAVIRGIAINNDGMRKGSFAAPSIEGQAEVITAALAQQNIHPESIGFMEAHGTGTAVGDPIEVAALTKAYRQWTDKKQFCAIGSVKTNIGHTDAAAGTAGLLKAVLALKHRQRPPILHYEEPNPDLDLENSPFHVQTKLEAWHSETQRRAAVSSFGLGGTNAHAVLEEYPQELLVSSPVSRAFKLLPFSARSQASFDRHAERWIHFLKEQPEINLADAAFTLQCGRAAFAKRGFVVAGSAEDAMQQLEAGALKVQPAAVARRDVVFLFTGQGAQYPGMARATYFNEPVFSRELDRCSDLLEPLLGARLVDFLYGEGGNHDLNQTSLAQPALFAVVYAQAKLWMSWGVRPACMLGHSIGEFVAAVLAGVFSLEDALQLVAERGRLMQAIQAGSMLAVMHPQEKTRILLGQHPALDLASSNAPELCVVSGDHEAISAFVKSLDAVGIVNRPLHTSHAFHSRMMDGMLAEFATLVATVERHAPAIPYLSNVTGDWITATDACDPQYYARHIRQTVLFSEGVRRLMEKPDRLFLEMGPGRTLVTFVSKHMDDGAATVIIPTMPGAQEDQASSRFVMEALGKAWASGAEIDWKTLYADEARRRIPLPTYPFDEKPYRLGNQDAAPKLDPGVLAKHSNLADWFHSPGWRQQPALIMEKPAASWMLLGNAPDALVRQLGKVIHSPVSPGDESAIDSAIADLAASDQLPDQILISWTLDGPEFLPSIKTVDMGRAGTVETIRALVLAWIRHGGGKTLTIHFLTRAFHDIVGNERAQPQWSFLIASCLVVTQEFPSIRCRHVDLPSEAIDDRMAQSILADCTSPDAEPCIAWRGGRRWVRDYAGVPLQESTSTPLREGGVYLITGGLGRVGLLFAEHIARKTKAKLVLLGRAVMPARADWPELIASPATEPGLVDRLKRLLAIEELGAELWILSADAGSADEFVQAIASTRSRFGAIHGIIHAAGIVSSQTIQQSKADDLKRFLHAKTHGVLAIYQATRGIPLDFCLLTSSLSAVLGGLGYHAYAAGNAFLDQFARWANQDSTFPWISINWDAWRFAGDGDAGLGSAMYRIAMTQEESLEVLDRVLAHLHISRNGLVISTAQLAPRLAQWVHGPTKRAPEAPSRAAPSAGTACERMIGIWNYCLLREVSADDDYFDLGGDSLMAVGLFTEIEREFGKALPMSSLFNSPTPAKLAALVEEAESPAVRESPAVPTIREIPSHVISIRENGDLRPLFCIHGADGGVLFYREFGLRLDENRPFHAIEAPMLQDPELDARDSVAAIARAYLEDIRRIQPNGPYLLGGYSFGGIVAYEMARQLKEAGISTTRVLLFDSPNPASPIRRFSLVERIQAQWNLQRDSGPLCKLASLAMRAVSGSVFRLRLEIENRLAARSHASEGGYLRHIQSRQQHDALYDAYVPAPYDGEIHLIIAQAGGGDKFAYEKNLGWDESLVPRLEVTEVPGSHLDIFREPYLSHLLKTTRAVLADED